MRGTRLVAYDQRGFSLVAAIFILVIVALLGAFMVTMSVIERSTSSYAVRGARAYQTALSGVEWGIRRAIATSACPATTTIAMNAPGLNGFSVTVQCTANSHMEPQSNGTNPFRVYVITATASAGTFGTPEYFSRSAEATVTDASPP